MHPFEHIRGRGRDQVKDGMRTFIDTARRRGMTEIVFTEHCPLLPNISDDQFATYVDVAQELIAETRDLTVYLGVELDYHPQLLDDAQRLLARYPFDYVLGSVHIHTDLYRDEILGKSYDEAISLALCMTGKAVETGLFDTIAHLDFCRWLSDPRRFGQWPGCYDPFRHQEAIQEILRDMAQRGVVLEINTSGLEKSFAATLPCADILSWADRYDDLLYSYGSDAHCAEKVGEHQQTVLDLLTPRQQARVVDIRSIVRRRQGATPCA